MTEKNRLFYLMQLAGGTFPSGGFSQSWGLETYVSDGRVKSAEAFMTFAKVYMERTVGSCEGPILHKAYKLADHWSVDEICELESLSCAVKLTKESRESSLRMGKAFLRILSGVLEDPQIDELAKTFMAKGISYPVVYGLVCGKLRIGAHASMEAFVFSTVNALVQSAVKLIPLGNTEAQKVLLDLQPAMGQAVDQSLSTDIEDISNFNPGFDIASMAHEVLPVRLYMS